MKEFIVSLVLIPILLYFPAQNILDNLNNVKINALNSIVQKHAQVARYDGYFKDANIIQMKDEIHRAIYIDISEIQFTGTTVAKYRTDAFDSRELITYEVTVPLKKVIAMPTIWGMSEADNRKEYTIKNAVASELLP
jgi:hypothetical protein